MHQCDYFSFMSIYVHRIVIGGKKTASCCWIPVLLEIHWRRRNAATLTSWHKPSPRQLLTCLLATVHIPSKLYHCRWFCFVPILGTSQLTKNKLLLSLKETLPHLAWLLNSVTCWLDVYLVWVLGFENNGLCWIFSVCQRSIQNLLGICIFVYHYLGAIVWFTFTVV